MLTVDISQLEDDDPIKLKIVRRFYYVKELVRAQPLSRTEKNVTELILRVSQRIGDYGPPSWASVNRWFRVYESADRGVRALASSYKSRGNRNPKISRRVPDHLTDEYYGKVREVAAIINRPVAGWEAGMLLTMKDTQRVSAPHITEAILPALRAFDDGAVLGKDYTVG